MLSLEKLQISRGSAPLFQPLTLSITPGQIWQVCGHNGSGKTSLLRVLCGLSPWQHGTIYWQQQPLAECREDYCQQLIYIAHQSGLNPLLTVSQNLAFYARLLGSKQSLPKTLEPLGLSQHAHDAAGRLSAGQQRRLSLARLLLTERPLWILDEPFNALDQSAVAWLQALILQHHAQGGTVIYTSHQTVDLPGVQTLVLQA